MSEEYNPQEAFLKYQKEMEGQPIHPRAIDAGTKELEQGEKGDFAVYGDEPGKQEIIKSYPTGEILKGNMSEAELQDEINRLTVARKAITSFLEHPTVTGFTNAKEFTLTDLAHKEEELTGDMVWAITTLVEKQIDPDESLFEVPGDIDSIIQTDTATLESLHRKNSEEEE